MTMQTRTLRNSLVAVSALALLLVGCGAEPASDRIAAQVAPVATATVPAAAPGEDDSGAGGGGATDPAGLGKQCYVDCAVVKSDPMGPMCPARVTGYGKTTFLGGCGKACTHAEGDAASKLVAGCSLDNCTRRGC